ncbi:MAG: creatininase family protein [Armatimonadota bacterium]|nr:creatininase family protein [Armatimonadota bacterium]MCX7776497.1 creatininase family protein [Armatimonadota bacterium]MDW8024294.1 creatininase family protein [Armatimonadota bacterium]
MAYRASSHRYELMRPGEIESERQHAPIAYIPWGSLEWHGLHNAIGLDALKAHAIALDAADITGGVVLPPIFAGYGTMKPFKGFKHTIEVSAETIKALLRELLEQLKDEGFKVLVLIMGHYGKQHVDALMSICEEFQSRHCDIVVLAFPEYQVAVEDGIRGDHAGAYETSLMMHYYPETVDLTLLPKGRKLSIDEDGVGGEDPRVQASAQFGKETAQLIVRRIAERVNETLKSIRTA